MENTCGLKTSYNIMKKQLEKYKTGDAPEADRSGHLEESLS